MATDIDTPGVMPASWRISQKISQLRKEWFRATKDRRDEIDHEVARLEDQWAEERRRECM